MSEASSEARTTSSIVLNWPVVSERSVDEGGQYLRTKPASPTPLYVARRFSGSSLSWPRMSGVLSSDGVCVFIETTFVVVFALQQAAIDHFLSGLEMACFLGHGALLLNFGRHHPFFFSPLLFFIAKASW